MDSIGPVVFWTVQVLALILFVLGIGAFRSLVQGCFVLRRMTRAGSRDYADVLLKSPLVPAVTTIAVPPDASAESRQFTRRLLDLNFGRNEVVIVLDGPSESDMAVWRNEYKLYESARSVERKLPTAHVRGIYESRDPIRVVIVEKDPGGVVDAWNCGVNVATSPVIGMLDPASEFEPFVLLRVIQPMLEASDETVAVCAAAPMASGADLASRFAAIESLRAWLTRGAAFAGANSTLPIPGSAVLARRDAIIEAGGFTGGALELIARLHSFCRAARKPYRIAFLPAPTSLARTPRGFGQLRQTVRRDQNELALAFKHASRLGAGKLLRDLSFDRSWRPKLETLVYLLTIAGLVMRWVDLPLAAFVLLSTVGIGLVQSFAALALREVAQPARSQASHLMGLFLAAIPENFGYRQLRNLWLIADSFVRDPSPKQNRGSLATSPTPATSSTPTKE